MTLVSSPPALSSLEAVLEVARRRIEVSDEELDEARRRRQLIADALRREFGGRVYFNGSVAHGDALDPLTDVDEGIVVPDPYSEYGPGKKGPTELEERAAEAIKRALRPEFPNLRVEYVGRKRSILVHFGAPVTAGQKDFTADVIVAIDNPTALGLYIPRFIGWDRAHPVGHTALVKEANMRTRSTFARVVRLIKHWDRRHEMPLCSWNVKALALGCIREEGELVPSLASWFDYAISELRIGETKDPTHVSDKPIKINEKWTMTDVLAELERGKASLGAAIRFEREGYLMLALDELARFFNDEEMLPRPNRTDVMREQARHTRAQVARDSSTMGAPALLTSISGRPRINASSWGA